MEPQRKQRGSNDFFCMTMIWLPLHENPILEMRSLVVRLVLQMKHKFFVLLARVRAGTGYGHEPDMLWLMREC